MTLSTLIKNLQEAQVAYGDQQVKEAKITIQGTDGIGDDVICDIDYCDSDDEDDDGEAL